MNIQYYSFTIDILLFVVVREVIWEVTSMICKNCGMDVPEEYNFCAYCGSDMRFQKQMMPTYPVQQSEEQPK